MFFSLTLTGYSRSVSSASRKTPNFPYGKLRIVPLGNPVYRKGCLLTEPVFRSTVYSGCKRHSRVTEALGKYRRRKPGFPRKSYIHYTLTLWVAM